MKPRYPVYVPTKGRWESRLTIRTLDSLGVSYKAVIEAQEVENYVRSGVKRENILILPHRDKGLVVTRNWIWDHALASGTPRFWTFDDNIMGFVRLNRNLRIPIVTANFFSVLEDFVDRYENVPIAGFQYRFFAAARSKWPPFALNRRVYSNMLIQTDARDLSGKPYRNEGFYNDDTDLCLRVLKDGYCTVLFYAFLANKAATMTVKGGMTPHYQPNQDGKDNRDSDGRYRMALELQKKHPDVTKIVWKWGRWQHEVDYSAFKDNRLQFRNDVVVSEGIDNYGIVLKNDLTSC
jgi:hypothetical protein